MLEDINFKGFFIMKQIQNNFAQWHAKSSLNTIQSLALGLMVITFTSSTCAFQESSIEKNIIFEKVELLEQKNHLDHAQTENHIEHIQAEIDQQLYDVFTKFFDEQDTTPFSKTVGRIISLLKMKRKILHGQKLAECEELIKTLEKNKYNSSFPVWAKILITPELLNLMSQETRTYINNVSVHVKINSLINKLKK